MPDFRSWAEWSIEWETQALEITDAGIMLYAETGGVATVGGLPWEESPLWAGVADLNRRILTAVGVPLRQEHELALGDRMLTAALLTHWRDHPLSPWDPDRVPDASERTDDKRKIIRSNIRGVRGAVSVIYRALYRHDPATLDGLELWQVASLLGRDDPDEQEETDAEMGGGTTKWNRRGNRESTSWRRHPKQRYLFRAPPSVTMPQQTRPRRFL